MPLAAVVPGVPTCRPIARLGLVVGGTSKGTSRKQFTSAKSAGNRVTTALRGELHEARLTGDRVLRPCTSDQQRACSSTAGANAVGTAEAAPDRDWSPCGLYISAFTVAIAVGLLETAAASPAAASALGSASSHNAQLVWQVADVATAAGDATATAATAAVQSDWLTPVSNTLETVLAQLNSGLVALHVPYSYGWSIIALTALVKLATYPFTKIQVESAINTQALKPQTDLIKRRYGDDKERIQRETSALYERAGVNPLAGCLPTLATIPVFWGLFRSLTNAATSGALSEGFYFIPSLSGPVSAAQRASGAGISWLYPLLPSGEPPIGWDEASRYLVLPVLLVLAQFASTALITPKKTPEEEKEENPTIKLLIKVLPLVVGWFSLNLPSGLGLYYFSNTVFTTGQQLWLRRGQADRQLDVGPINVGQARHTGVPAPAVVPFKISFEQRPGALNSATSDAAPPQQDGVTAALTAAGTESLPAGNALTAPDAVLAGEQKDAPPTAMAAASNESSAWGTDIGGAASEAAAAQDTLQPINMRCKRQRLAPATATSPQTQSADDTE